MCMVLYPVNILIHQNIQNGYKLQVYLCSSGGDVDCVGEFLECFANNGGGILLLTCEKLYPFRVCTIILDFLL